MFKLLSPIALMLGCAIALAGTAIAFADDEKPVAKAAKEKKTAEDKPAAEEDKPAEKAKTEDEKGADPEKVLTAKGLTKDERKFHLDEAAAIEKYEAAKPLLADLQKAMYKYATIVNYDQTLAEMQMEHQAMQQQSNYLQQQINSMANSGYGRMRQMQNAQLAPLRAQHTQMQAQVNQMNSQINSAKGQAPKQQDRQAATGDFEKSRQAYLDAIRELDTVVAPLLATYHELALDKSVIESLAKMKHDTGMVYKVGPSEQVVAASVLIRELKKMTGTTTKSSKSARKKAKTKGS